MGNLDNIYLYSVLLPDGPAFQFISDRQSEGFEQAVLSIIKDMAFADAMFQKEFEDELVREVYRVTGSEIRVIPTMRVFRKRERTQTCSQNSTYLR